MYYQYIEQDFATDICEKIKDTPLDQFIIRNPAWRRLSHSSTIKEMEAIVGIRDAKELHLSGRHKIDVVDRRAFGMPKLSNPV